MNRGKFRLEIFAPELQRAGVVRGHVFVVEEIQIPGRDHRLGDAGVAHQERPGKNVLLDKIHTVAEDRILAVRTQDRLQGEKAVRLEHLVDFFEVAVHVAVSDRLEHLDRNHLVEASPDGAVVAEENLDLVREPGCLDPLRRLGKLFLGDRHRGDSAMVVPGRVNAEAAPAASDFQNFVGRREVEFPAQQVVFPDLRGFQRGFGGVKIPARIRHRGVEPELEEFVAEVVVVADVFPAGGEAVRAAPVDGAVHEVQDVEDSGSPRAVGLQRFGIAGVQDEPGDDFGDVGSFPLGRHEAFRKSDGPEKHAAPEEGFLEDPDVRVEPVVDAAINLLGPIGQNDRQRAVLQLGKTIEDQIPEDHFVGRLRARSKVGAGRSQAARSMSTLPPRWSFPAASTASTMRARG